MSDIIGVAATILGGVVCLIGLFISLRGFWRSQSAEKLDTKSYFKGLALIIAGVGLMWLGELV